MKMEYWLVVALLFCGTLASGCIASGDAPSDPRSPGEDSNLPPPDDYCLDATPLSVGTFNGSTVDALDSHHGFCDHGQGGPDQLFAFSLSEVSSVTLFAEGMSPSSSSTALQRHDRI